MRRWQVLFLPLALAGAPLAAQSDASSTIEQGRAARWQLAEHRKLAAMMAALKPQRPGVVDAFVLSAGLDSDPVFGREAAEASRVLARRYDADGRTMLLAAGEGAASAAVPNGSPAHLSVALAAIAERMDLKEDVLVLFATAHGSPETGLAYRDGVHGSGMVGPQRLANLLDELGIKRRLVIISACYSGIFVPPLASDDSIVVTAASATTTSFGCVATNDWTYFGDALVNGGLRQPQPLEAAARQAFATISGWERKDSLFPSDPQMSIGAKAANWLRALEARMPKTASVRTGKPAVAP